MSRGVTFTEADGRTSRLDDLFELRFEKDGQAYLYGWREGSNQVKDDISIAQADPHRVVLIEFDREDDDAIQMSLTEAPDAPSLEWQSIETAPKDARGIVATCDDGLGWLVGEAFRDSIGVWWWAQTMPSDEGGEIDPQPTFWMPFPHPPTALSAPLREQK